MRQKTSHTGDPDTSQRLRTAVNILKEASGPLTGKEMREASQRPGEYYLENPSTCVFEIGKAPGYAVSDGQSYGQKQGPAVKFPDGKYRYWLIEAPGWRNSWTVNSDFQVVPVNRCVLEQGNRVPVVEQHVIMDDLVHTQHVIADDLVHTRTCRSCGKPIGDGPPFCNELCKNSFLGIGAP